MLHLVECVCTVFKEVEIKTLLHHVASQCCKTTVQETEDLVAHIISNSSHMLDYIGGVLRIVHD